MRKRCSILFAVLICLLTTVMISTSPALAASLSGKTIIVDAGHGGYNPGAVANGSVEKDNNLAVALLLEQQLKEAGAKVVMTRRTDRAVADKTTTLRSELQARVDIAEQYDGDIFVSIHSNSNNDRNIHGAMTFYSTDRSKKLAKTIQKNLIYRSKAQDKGIENAGFYVLRNTSMPSVLVEMGFVTNPQEAKRLSNAAYRQKIANGIYEGIEEYFRD